MGSSLTDSIKMGVGLNVRVRESPGGSELGLWVGYMAETRRLRFVPHRIL